MLPLNTSLAGLSELLAPNDGSRSVLKASESLEAPVLASPSETSRVVLAIFSVPGAALGTRSPERVTLALAAEA